MPHRQSDQLSKHPFVGDAGLSGWLSTMRKDRHAAFCGKAFSRGGGSCRRTVAAGCGSGITSSIGSLPSRTATVSGRPSVTAAPTAQPPTHSGTTVAPVVPSSLPATPAASSGTSLIWLWVLLGVLVLAGLIALIVRSARRRSAAGRAGGPGSSTRTRRARRCVMR